MDHGAAASGDEMVGSSRIAWSHRRPPPGSQLGCLVRGSSEKIADEHCGELEAHPGWRWIPRHKPLWFAPLPSHEGALPGEALLEALPLDESLLFTRLDGADAQLVFIVPDDWGQADANAGP